MFQEQKRLNRGCICPVLVEGPAYDLTKEQIARFLGLSDSTLYQRRLELAVEERRSEISDEELDREIREILCLTPHSG